jgi:pilus assembly protein CpaB
MNRKTGSILMIALVCGLGAMFASSRMLVGSPAASVEMQQVVLAVRDLSVEEVLKPDMIKIESMPKSAVPAGAFASFREIADRWVQIKILEGEPIVEKKLAPKGTPTGLVARIPRGKRAFAITVNEQTGVSGFVMPDHRVDLFQVQSSPNGEGTRAVPVLQDVLVLASGTNIQSTLDRTIQARTVTVAVTPEEAAILTVAQSKGQLSLALRSQNDHELTAPPPEPVPAELPKVALAQPAPAPEPPPKPSSREKSVDYDDTPVTPRHVTIYRGGKPPERVRVDQPPSEEEEGLGFPSANDLATQPPAAPPPQTSPPTTPQ